MSHYRVATLNVAGSGVPDFEGRLRTLKKWVCDGDGDGIQGGDGFPPVNPDVLLLQEVASVEQARMVADTLGYQLFVGEQNLAEEGLMVAVLYKPEHLFYSGETLNFGGLGLQHFPGRVSPPYGLVAKLVLFGRFPVVVVTSHAPWGFYRESRVKFVRFVDEYLHSRWVHANELNRPRYPVVWGGDFNAARSEDSVQYLVGNRVFDDEGQGDGSVGRCATEWVDVFDVFNKGRGEAETATVSPENHLVVHAADVVGISRPSLLPYRKIDYLFAYGFPWGNPGSPLASGRWGDVPGCEVSDHYGLWGDFLLAA